MGVAVIGKSNIASSDWAPSSSTRISLGVDCGGADTATRSGVLYHSESSIMAGSEPYNFGKDTQQQILWAITLLVSAFQGYNIISLLTMWTQYSS